MLISKFSGRPSFVWSSDREYWVLAMQTGRFPKPMSSIFFSARSAAGDKLEAVQNCVCALAELEQDAGKLDSLVYTTDRPVSSETVGGWSRSFGSRNLSQADMQRTETRRREIVLAYLGPTGLLKARGYGPCPCSPTP